MNKSIKAGFVGVASFMVLVAGVASAMETTGGSVMTASDTMMQKESMMKTDAMAMHEVNLMMGSRGDDVITLQTFLESHGFLTLPAGAVKGYFGALTKMGLKKYQESVGLTAAGYYGPMTRAAIAKSMSMKTESMMGSDTMMHSGTMTNGESMMTDKSMMIQDLMKKLQALNAQIMVEKQKMGGAMMSSSSDSMMH